jgi:hypothetical protein
MIEIKDNLLEAEQYLYVLNYCQRAKFTWGETDDYNLPPTGMVHEIDETELIYQVFRSKTQEIVPNLNLHRMYVNCFAPSENPYFHIDWEDKGAVTFLFYPTEGWNYDDGGETQFIVDDEIYGVTPVPNRLVYFDADIPHKATSFRDRHRFTLAVKYIP